MVISHNMAAMNAQRQFNIVSNDKKKSVEKLSSGYKINRAADNAAGLSISEKMRSQIRALSRDQDNIQDGISFAQTADGALEQTTEILQRLNELSIQAANGTLSTADRAAIDAEVKQLKYEMNRIFQTTTFNGKNIWGDHGKMDAVIHTSNNAVTPNFSGTQKVDNYNVNKLPKDGNFHINATQDGIKIQWQSMDSASKVATDYNYSTSIIPYDDIINGQKINLSSYIDKTVEPYKSDLYRGGDKMVFDYEFSFDFDRQEFFADKTTTEQNYPAKYIQSLDGSSYPISYSQPTSISFNNGSPFYSYSLSIERSVLYEHGYDFEKSDTLFIEPDLVEVDDNGVKTKTNQTGKPSTDADTWKFSFLVTKGTKDADGNLVKSKTNGKLDTTAVTATCTGMTYWSDGHGGDDATKGTWWEYNEYYKRNDTITYNIGNTLGDLKNALNGTASKPGLTNKTSIDPNTGAVINDEKNANGGVICMDYSIDGIGKFSMYMSVDSKLSADDMIKKINNALDKKTAVIDISSPAFVNGKSTANANTNRRNWSYNTVTIDHNLPTTYDAYYPYMDLSIQSGPETGEYIHMKYQNMHTTLLGIDDMSLATQDGALRAIDQVSGAIAKVASARSEFGAYQNRMEHAYEIDAISEENTTASESAIRDTDMAHEMVKLAKHNILEQAGQSMLAQANQTTQGALSLLQ